MGKVTLVQKKSIRTKLIFFLLVLVVIPMIFGFIAYSRIATQIIKDQLIEREQALLHQSVQQINRILGLLSVSLNYLASSSAVQNVDANVFLAPQDSFLHIRELQSAIHLVRIGAFQYPLSIFLINDDSMISTVSNIRRTHEVFAQSEWYQLTKKNRSSMHWTLETFSYLAEEGLVSSNFLTVARAVDRSRAGDDAFTVAISIDTEYLSRILNPEMEILVEPHQLNGSFENENLMILEQALENGWLLRYTIDQNAMLKQLKVVENWGVFLVIALGMFVTFIIVFNVHASTKNLLLLKKRITQVKAGDFSVRMPQLGTGEVGLVASQFNEMLSQIQYLFEEIKRSQILLEEARFMQLQAQIRPHFLLNSLNTINWAAQMSGAYNVSDIALALCGILEKTLYQHASFVHLSDEIKTLNEYLTIEQLRTGDRWDLRLETPEFSVDPYVPIFLLQPLVENAVTHAWDQKSNEMIHIWVRFSVLAGTLVCAIEDDGKGFDSDEYTSLLKQEARPENKSGGIGLANIHQRIVAHFGSGYGIEIQKRKPKGTIVLVKLPFLEESP